MAILPAVPGVRVTIECNGQPLPEYPDEDDFAHKRVSAPPERTSKTFIECVSDAEFQIVWDITQDFSPNLSHSHLTIWSEVDGFRIGGRWSPISLGSTWFGSTDECIRRINTTEVVYQKLKFSSITKVENADAAKISSDIKQTDGLGEILVFVHRTNVSNTEKQRVWNDTRKPTLDEISEKALKGQAVSHSVALGAERRAELSFTPIMTYPDGESNPLAIFRFKYRSREALQQELIIPRSPSPDDLVMGPSNPRRSQAKRQEPTEERLARLKREIAEIKTEVKVEGGLKRRADSVEIQSSGRAYKTSRNANGSVVVDLTDD